MGEIVSLVSNFNSQVRHYQFDIGCAVAADMTDCFRHLPCEHFADMWDDLAGYWEAQHVFAVSVPHKRFGCRGILGRCDEPGWTCLDFASIRIVLCALCRHKPCQHRWLARPRAARGSSGRCSELRAVAPMEVAS